jgi:hypothetical protein
VENEQYINYLTFVYRSASLESTHKECHTASSINFVCNKDSVKLDTVQRSNGSVADLRLQTDASQIYMDVWDMYYLHPGSNIFHKTFT